MRIEFDDINKLIEMYAEENKISNDMATNSLKYVGCRIPISPINFKPILVIYFRLGEGVYQCRHDLDEEYDSEYYTILMDWYRNN